MFERPPKVTPEVKPTPQYSPDDMSFEAQYSRVKQLEINNVKVNTVFIDPENKKTDTYVFVLHGWGASMESFKPAMKVLAEKGRPVVSFDFPRKGGDIPDWYNKDIAEWYESHGIENSVPNLPKEFLRQANTILGLLDKEKIEKADVIAHSMAGPSVCIAAMMHPEKFAGRTIILTNSAGLIGKDSFNRLRKGAGANTSRTPTMSGIPITEEETKYLESTKHITPDYMKANPLRAVKEVWDISRVQITEDMLRYLKEKGIKVIIVGAVEDTMFPMGTLSEQREVLGLNERKSFVGNKGMQKNVEGDAVAGFVSTRGGHMQIQVNSKEFMSALETMLPQPEGKKG